MHSEQPVAAPAVAREPVDVAVGVLFDGPGPDARFLLTSRPAGKVYTGWWEFPGGKFESGESVQQALARELHEEIGIAIGTAHPWRQELVDYPHALVRLHFCKVFAWTGDFEMREGQAMAWQTLPVQVHPVLPGTLPVLRWLAEERGHTGPTHREAADAPAAAPTDAPNA
jgi:8-oxo-dGTP diphosphatase